MTLNPLSPRRGLQGFVSGGVLWTCWGDAWGLETGKLLVVEAGGDEGVSNCTPAD